MYFLNDVSEIQLVGALDRGRPNEERIALHNASDNLIDLSPYALLVGQMTGTDLIYPFNNYFFWLGNRRLAPHSWLFIFTGTGTELVTSEAESSEPALVVHWGHEGVLFVNDRIVPALVRFDSLTIEKNAVMLPSASQHRG